MNLVTSTSITTEIYNKETKELIAQIHWSDNPHNEGYPIEEFIKLFGPEVLKKCNIVIKTIGEQKNTEEEINKLMEKI